MPKGDWGEGARLEPLMVNIAVDPTTLAISHVGIGYHVRLPSGKRHPSGFSWTDYDPGLQRFVDEMLAAAAEHEGVEAPGAAQITDVDGSQTE